MEYDKKLAVLEAAHVRFQQNALAHFKVHCQMFCLAIRYRKGSEALGQIPRLILAIPGSISGRAPKGNVGSTTMGIFEEIKN